MHDALAEVKRSAALRPSGTVALGPACHASHDALRSFVNKTFADERAETLLFTGAAKRIAPDTG